ncbi:MAG TPA: histidine kinase [Firmicutes bacterium]|nr:histidine kinase [Bacillota bacterium]
MVDRILSTGALEKILEETLGALEDGRNQIYEVAETARQERDRTEETLNGVRQEMDQAIYDVEYLSRQFTLARQRLYNVSKDYDDYTEDEKRRAYEEANRLREQLALAREREQSLRVRRDSLEQTFAKLQEIVEKAERLVSQVGVALNYLAGNLQDVDKEIKNIQIREQLGQEILKGQEHERKRMAGALHDGPVQDLANVIVQIEICERLYDTGRQTEARESFGGLKSIVQNSMKDMRRIIYDLNPMTLEDLGLVATVKNLLEELEKTSGIKTYLNVLGDEKRLESNIELNLFRTIQEALNNSRKHAKPETIEVTFEYLAHQVNVEVKDDGIGFSLEKAQHKIGSGKHFGLLSMQNRIKIIGGTLRIAAEPGKGTRILLKTPFGGT